MFTVTESQSGLSYVIYMTYEAYDMRIEGDRYENAYLVCINPLDDEEETVSYDRTFFP